MPVHSIRSLLSGLSAVPGHKPWPRYEIGAQTWEELGRALGAGQGDLLGLWADPGQVHMALRADDVPAPCVVSLGIKERTFPSVARHHAPAARLERAVHDLHGFEAIGTPDRRPWLDHGQWGVTAPLGLSLKSDRRDPADYDFLPVNGEGLHQVAVGPVHASIIEPGHFRFHANGETVARLEARLGYVHKGVDSLLVDADMEKAARILARVSGDSTVALGFAFARAVEAALAASVPARATILRGVMAELERIANHIGDIGAICNDASFALIHAHCGMLRERVLAACDAAFGHRLMMDRIVPGGVTQDVTPEGVRAVLEALEAIAPPFAEIVRLYDETPSLQDRTCTTGAISNELVRKWGAGGYVGRAAGREFDCRRDLAYLPYAGVAFAVPMFQTGDVDARVWVRIREVETSIGLVRTWLAALPGGAVFAPPPRPDGVREGIAMTEAFRGDLLVWLRITEGGRIAHAHVRDASWFQWPLLEAAIEHNIVADFPICNKSFNCSYSGHDL